MDSKQDGYGSAISKIANNKGMTLPEVIIALLLIGVGLIPLVQVAEFTLRNQINSELQDEVMVIVQQGFELGEGDEPLRRLSSGEEVLVSRVEEVIHIQSLDGASRIKMTQATIQIDDQKGGSWKFVTRKAME